MTAALLSLHQVHKRFGRSAIIQGVSLDVQAGERVALIGPNGAGKSTLFNVISGRFRPDQGHIHLRGQRIDGLPPEQVHRLGLARSFQISQLFDGLSVLDNLRCAALWRSGVGYAFWRRLSRVRAAQERAEEVMTLLQLTHQRDTLAAHLSYAEQRALELGITVASDAQVLLLDEPTAGMSRAETAHTVALIHRLSEGKTLLMVEHDMAVVFELADKVAVLVQGEVLAFGSPAQVRADPRVQAAYLGADWAPISAPSQQDGEPEFLPLTPGDVGERSTVSEGACPPPKHLG